MSNYYYTTEELDSMPIGKELFSALGYPWHKMQNHVWGNLTSVGSSKELGMFFPKETPVGDSGSSPTMGELVALRDSYWRTDREAYESGVDRSNEAIEKLVQRINHVDHLIDQRTGLS